MRKNIILHIIIEVETIFKGSLDSISSPSSSVNIQIMGGKSLFKCKRQNIANNLLKKKKFFDITQQRFALLPQVDIPAIIWIFNKGEDDGI